MVLDLAVLGFHISFQVVDLSLVLLGDLDDFFLILLSNTLHVTVLALHKGIHPRLELHFCDLTVL